MKKIIFSFLVCALALLKVQAQGPLELKPVKDIPLTVKEAFEKEFIGTDPVWYTRYRGKNEDKLRFEAKFMFNKRYANASYDEVGNLKALAFTINNSEVPAEALNYMKQQYPTLKVNEALEVTRKSENTYELGAFVEGVYTVFVFSDKGEFIKSGKS